MQIKENATLTEWNQSHAEARWRGWRSTHPKGEILSQRRSERKEDFEIHRDLTGLIGIKQENRENQGRRENREDQEIGGNRVDFMESGQGAIQKVLELTRDAGPGERRH